jgi:hypothetical protein
MEYLLYFNNNDNKYYLIINKAINFNIAIEFETFNKLLISNEILSNSKYIEFNEDNLNNFLKEFNFSKLYRFTSWIEVFEFYKNI